MSRFCAGRSGSGRDEILRQSILNEILFQRAVGNLEDSIFFLKV
jgi:hypothetical protein